MPAVAANGTKRVRIDYLGVDLATHTPRVTRSVPRGRPRKVRSQAVWGCVVDKASNRLPSRGERGLPLSDVGCHPVVVPKGQTEPEITDRKSTRLNSSHRCISYAVFCLKKK